MKARKINPFLIAYAVALLVLAGAGYACADFTVRANHDAKAALEQAKSHTDVTFVDLPRLNLEVPNFRGHAVGHVRMDITLEVDKKYALELQGYTPRISERVSDYARTMDMEDVAPPKAAQRLRQNLMQEVSTGSFPVPVIDVIFKQFVIL